VLEISDVTKRFGALTAVDGLSFTVEPGRVLGFLGPNGAGKTTTLRMVIGLLRPDAGTITVLDQKPGPATFPEIGFLPEERGLYRKMTALDVVTYFGRLKGMTRDAARREAMALLERLELGPVARRKVGTFSKGMAQKVQLAAALVNRPRLIMLDEPFSGLDPINQEVLENLVRERVAEGATVVFSTHVMPNAERLCDRLVVIAGGRPVFTGTPEAARALLPRRILIESRETPEGLPGITGATRGETLDVGWTAWTLDVAAGAPVGAVLEAAFDRGLVLRRFDRLEPSLHEVFIRLVGEALI
jgi:ABC-2 type transport system ATP-binding protein